MNEQNLEKQLHKDGTPWDNKKVFSTFGEADLFRKSILADNKKQVKVKRYVNASGVETFVVKVREVPDVAPKEEKLKKNKKT